MITTISAYYKNGGVIFDSTLTDYEYMTSDIITALDNILKYRYGRNNLFTDDQTEIIDVINAMFALNDDKYTALYNVDKIVDPSDEYRETKTNTGTQATTHTGNTTLNDTGTQTNQNTPGVIGTITNSKNTSDSGVLRVIDQTQTTNTGSDTDTRTDNLQHQRTDNLTDTRTDNLTEIRQGYNNKFSNADFVLNLLRNNLYDTIIDDTISSIVIPVYDYDDLEV